MSRSASVVTATVINDRGERVYSPYNPSNKMWGRGDILSILAPYGITHIYDLDLYKLAAVHKSYGRKNAYETQTGDRVKLDSCPPDCMDLFDDDNEELEFMGDSILGCIIATYLMDRYGGAGEGFLTRIKTKLVCNDTLGTLAIKLGFHEWICISNHIEQKAGRKHLTVLGSMMEAFIGAMYKDHNSIKHDHPGIPGMKIMSGFEVCRQFLVNLFEAELDFTDIIRINTNYKDSLLRYYQKTFHQPPRYKEVNITGPPHDRIFTVAVLDVHGAVFATGTSRNKTEASQLASKEALSRFGVAEY